MKKKGLDFDIEVDGGIDSQSISQAKEAGANVFVAGSYVLMEMSMSVFKRSEML